jgi:hypothetical protein
MVAGFIAAQFRQAQNYVAFRRPDFPARARFLTFLTASGIAPSLSSSADSFFVAGFMFRL